APILARLLAAASLTGLLNTLHSNGLAFNQVSSDFTLTDSVITLARLRAHGGALGLTAAGSFDIQASRVDLKGTIIPLYEVNTVLGIFQSLAILCSGGRGKGSLPSLPGSPHAFHTLRSASLLPH